MTLHSVFGAPGGIVPASQPPKKTYLPTGAIKSAWRSVEVPYAGVRSRRTGAQKAGLAYQKRIGGFLPSRGNQWSVVVGPWYCYTDDSPGRHYCQPDFLLDDPANETCVVVEVKIRWTTDAWWQLQRLYLPVLRKAMPSRLLLPLVICRGYDPALPPPEEVNLCSDLLDVKPSVFNVLVVK